MVHNTSDISFAVGLIIRFTERPTILHLNATKRVLRYVKGTLDYGSKYTRGSDNLLLTGFSDTDYAMSSCIDKRSMSGMAFYLNESLITRIMQTQRWVTLSTCEAEFMVVTIAECQGICLEKLLSQIMIHHMTTDTLYR